MAVVEVAVVVQGVQDAEELVLQIVMDVQALVPVVVMDAVDVAHALDVLVVALGVAVVVPDVVEVV